MHIFLKPYFPCQMFKHFKEKAMTQTANDQRATVKNPNNIQHTQNQDNRRPAMALILSNHLSSGSSFFRNK